MDKHLMQPADSRKEDQESEETKDEMEYGEIVIQTTKTPECRKSMEKLSKKRKTSTCVTERKYPVVTQKTQNTNTLLKCL